MCYVMFYTPVYTLLSIGLYIMVYFITLMSIFDKNDGLLYIFDLLLSKYCVVFFQSVYIIARYRALQKSVNRLTSSNNGFETAL